MEEKLVKSESNCSLHMDGKSSIDAELLSNIIKDMCSMYHIK